MLISCWFSLPGTYKYQVLLYSVGVLLRSESHAENVF